MNISSIKYFFWGYASFPFRAAIVITFLFLNSNLLFSQNIENLHIEKVQDEELTSSAIVCINQDRNEFMWFGTGDGLFRYDGYNFKAFRNFPGDSTTLINNGVNAMFSDNNNLWAGTANGLCRIDINTLKITNFYITKSFKVNVIAPKSDSVLWVATSAGLYQFNKRDYSWQYVPAVKKGSPANSITDDHNGHLYLSSSSGFFCYTVASGASKFYQLDLPTYPAHDKSAKVPFAKSLMDNNGNLWLGTWDAGLVRFNPQTQKINTWFHPTDDVHLVPYKIVTALLADRFGNIWLANKEGGLTIFNPSTNNFINYPIEWKSENKISDAVISLYRDISGIVWIGTENGIFKYDPHHVYLSKKDLFLKTDTGIIPAHISPISMFRDRDGLLWLGMYEGLFTLDEKTGILKDCNEEAGLPKQFAFAVFNIAQDNKGIIWVTAKNLLIKIAKKSGSGFKAQIFKTDDIKSTMYVLFIDNENRVWIGTHSEGIFRFDPDTKKFIFYDCNVRNKNNKINEIRTFCELSKDSLLFGGAHTGLVLLHTNSRKYEKICLKNSGNFDSDLSIGTIYKKGNDLWLGTDNNGLWQTTTRFTNPFIVTTNDGLPAMLINSIVGDKRNNLWLLTYAGAVKFQINGKKLTVFDKRDGIQNLNELNAIMADNDGDISIGARGNIYRFNPAGILKNEAPPPVFITDMKVFDKNYTISKDETVKLNYNQNYFTFEYLALNYTQSRLNKYAYKMAGLDTKWNDAGTRRYVSYANLEEGTYTFYVKACNNEGVWNNVPAKLILVIIPPFWHRWWFYTLFIVLVIGSIYFLYWYNMNQLKMRLQLRNKIARDLHDDIGSTLSGINIFSKMALQKLKHNEAGGTDLLEKISDRSEKTMDALSDIVWSISTKNDHIDNFLVKAREYLTEMLEPQGIRYEMHVDEDISYLKLGMELRKEFYLIFKEAICNASKYAQCSLVEINLTKEKDIFTLTICDDGRGFDIHKVILGNGIQNMQHRAEKMKAKLEIISQVNAGTSITLSFRIPRFR